MLVPLILIAKSEIRHLLHVEIRNLACSDTGILILGFHIDIEIIHIEIESIQHIRYINPI